ncbi:MAG: hypothetical protein EPO35_09735 [Acidobacteria bacterium]|nr:MAG: hypothetical protein EPO35_09735 [Acidobacteriota bacterium]
MAWIAGAQPIAVTVVSDQPASYGPLLSQDPGIQATFVSPKNYSPGREQVLIFDRVLPASPAKVPALFVAPPAEPPIQTRSGLVSGPTLAETSPDLISGVDLRSMTFDFPRRYAAKDLTAVATGDDGTPLIYVHEEPDQRFVLFTFSVTDSKLMFAPGFPALMGNALDWLAHPAPGGTRKPGPATLTGAVQSIVGPDGKPVPVSHIDGVSLAKLNRVGFYTATSGGATSVIAVNAGDPEISDLQRTRLPQATRADASSSSRARPWWLYAAIGALLLLAAEWFTWQRRLTV